MLKLNDDGSEDKPEKCWKCCPLFCLKCIIIGWLGFPIHCLRMVICRNPERIMIHDDRPCHGVMDSETMCLPMKRTCSPNGRNKRYRMYLPFGITEILLLVTAFRFNLFFGLGKNMPFAYVDTAAVYPHTRSGSDMFMYTGNYNEYIAKKANGNYSLSFKWTMFDPDMIDTWDTTDAAVGHMPDYQPQAMSELFFNAAGRSPHNDTAPTFGNFKDVVIIGNNCFCRGYYPYDNTTMLPTLLTKTVCASKPSYCKPIVTKIDADFVDIPKGATALIAPTLAPFSVYSVLFCFVAALARCIYVYWKPIYLKTPGNGYLTGHYGLVFTYLATNAMKKLRTNFETMGDTSLGQYQIISEVKRGATMGGNFYALSHPLGLNYQILNNIVLTGNYSMLCHLIVILFSEYAYCIDFTPFAYLKDNLDQFRVKRRERADKVAMLLHMDKQL